MTALANGTYFISSMLGGSGCYLGFSSGMQEALVINNFTGLESQQWDIEPLESIYTFKNRRYRTYAIANHLAADVIAGSAPRNWSITPADSGYVIGTDQSGSSVWNVNQRSGQDNTIILRPFDKTLNQNQLWKISSVQQTEPSSASYSSPSSSSSSSSSSSTSSTSAPSSTCSCPAKEGLDLGDKIGLGVGLGVGIPTLLVAIVALFKDSPLAKLVEGKFSGEKPGSNEA